MRRMIHWTLLLALFVLPILAGCESQKLKDENAKLKQQVESTSKERDAIKAKVDEMTKSEGELKHKVDELTAKNEDLSKKLASLNKKAPAKKPAATTKTTKKKK
jgi:peptidoglycan hydrolase CwlO-like protein